jgi:hypothetical protein
MLKLNVGFNRKVGEANYGSRGAAVNLELEYDSALASDPERLKDRIRQLFTLAKASVEEELNGQASPASNGSNGSQADTNGNGHRRNGGRRATASQIRALHAIADRQQLDLATMLQSRFGANKPEDLSITEASELIDSLKAAGNGTGGRR